MTSTSQPYYLITSNKTNYTSVMKRFGTDNDVKKDTKIAYLSDQFIAARIVNILNSVSEVKQHLVGKMRPEDQKVLLSQIEEAVFYETGSKVA